MSAMAEKARSRAKDKVERLTRATSGPVDASGWTEPTDEKGGVQTGPRPVSRRQFKCGGKVSGDASTRHAGRKPRKSGGAAFADALVNRDIKKANEDREGPKHIGGMKRGGRAHKTMGGMALPAWSDSVSRKSGGRAHKLIGGGCGSPSPMAGRPMPIRPMMTRKSGGAIPDGTRPKGDRIARAKGGRAKKGMNVNIIIAPAGGAQRPAMPMPPPGMASPQGGPVGLHQGVPPPMPPAGAAPPMGPPPMARKRGGRAYPIDSGAGGGLGRLQKIEAYG